MAKVTWGQLHQGSALSMDLLFWCVCVAGGGGGGGGEGVVVESRGVVGWSGGTV